MSSISRGCGGLIVAPGQENNGGYHTGCKNQEDSFAEPEKHQVTDTKTETVDCQGTQNPMHDRATETGVPLYVRKFAINGAPESGIGSDFFTKPFEMLLVSRGRQQTNRQPGNRTDTNDYQKAILPVQVRNMIPVTNKFSELGGQQRAEDS